MNNIIKSAAELIIKRLPLKNIIIFESLPDYSDNARAVFDEMVKRGVNNDYILVWSCHSDGTLPENLKGIKNVYAENMNSFKYKYYYSYFAKCFAVSNYFMQKRREEQYYIYLAHGAAFKAIKDKRYSVPHDCFGCDFCAYSEYIGKFDVNNLNADVKDVNVVETGYARNDSLAKDNKKVNVLFNNKKIIYWLPTFRQKKDDNKSYSSISVPFIYDKENAGIINKCAEENGIIIILKPHPAQDLSALNFEGLSSVKLIDNKFLSDNKIKNYDILANSAALLTDYSSVFYDYLLCDKPIGLCWEDFDEYNRKEGFCIDINSITNGMEKLYTVDELCSFIQAVANGKDRLSKERNEVKNRIHKYTDFKFSERTVDYIMKKIKDA